MNKTLKILVFVAILVVIGAIVVLKNNGKTQYSGEVVKVGVIAPLTGPLAEYGEAFRNGILLAQEKNPNPKIQYVFEDSAYDSKKTISAFNKLKDTDKINILFNWGDPTSQALAPLVKDGSIPFVAFSSVAAVTQTSKYTVRPWDRPEDFANVIWKYLREKNLKNIGIVKVENTYLNSLYDALNKAKNNDETVTLVDNYLSYSDNDFRTSISKIKKLKSIDALGVYLISGQISQFYRQSDQLGLKIPTFGTDFFENQNDIDAAGASMNGAVYAHYNVSDNFRSEYLARFNNESQIAYAGNGYDVAMMLNQFDLSNKDTIIKAFAGIKGFKGVLGSYSFIESSTNRYLSLPIHIKLIQDKKTRAIN